MFAEVLPHICCSTKDGGPIWADSNHFSTSGLPWAARLGCTRLGSPGILGVPTGLALCRPGILQELQLRCAPSYRPSVRPATEKPNHVHQRICHLAGSRRYGIGQLVQGSCTGTLSHSDPNWPASQACEASEDPPSGDRASSGLLVTHSPALFTCIGGAQSGSACAGAVPVDAAMPIAIAGPAITRPIPPKADPQRIVVYRADLNAAPLSILSP